MNTPYAQTFGSFVRNSNYPLEADYVFTSIESLREWETENRKYLHEGLFKVVVLEDKQILYWVKDGTFVPLIESDSLEQLAYVLKDFELHGQLRDLLRDLQNNVASKLRSLQQELDETQAGAGLNGDGSFDQLNMKNTTYLDGSSSIVECLKALDAEMTNLVVDAFVQDAYYDTTTEEIVLTFLTKQEKVKTIRISMANLIREWEPDNTHPNKVIELTREEVLGGGADKLSADVRISEKDHNILEKDGNSLYVGGTSDNITVNGETLTTTISEIKDKENGLSEQLTAEKNRATQAEADILSKLDSATLVKQETAEPGYADTYYLSIDGNQVGVKINVPEDKVVKSVTVKEATNLNTPYPGAQIGDKYIEFVFQGNIDNLYLPVSDLVINYTEGNGISITNNTISAKVFINDKYLENSTDGIKSKGIDTAIENAKDSIKAMIDNKAPIESPVLTGIPQVAISPDPNDSSQRIPSTNWVNARIFEISQVNPDNYWLKLTE